MCGNPLIQGVSSSSNWEEHFSLYADNVLLHLLHPTMSLNRVLQVLRTFGDHSSYHINWYTSCMYTLVGGVPALSQRSTVPVALGDLHIYVTWDALEFLRRNPYELLDRFHQDVSHWRTLPLSLMSKAALYKMTALPRFLYALQNTPFPVPLAFFLKIEQEVHLHCGTVVVPR